MLKRINHKSTTNQPQINRKSTANQPHINHTSTTHQPQINHKSTTHQPQINHKSTTNQPQINHKKKGRGRRGTVGSLLYLLESTIGIIARAIAFVSNISPTKKKVNK